VAVFRKSAVISLADATGFATALYEAERNGRKSMEPAEYVAAEAGAHGVGSSNSEADATGFARD
jgi:hypothetical protein